MGARRSRAEGQGGSRVLSPGRYVGPPLGLFLSDSTERRLERALAEGQQRGGQLQEQLTQQLSQALSSAVAGRLERSIRDEIKKTVPPCEFHMETSGRARFEGPSPCQTSSHGSAPSSFSCPRCLPESRARGWPAQQLGGHQTHSCGE